MSERKFPEIIFPNILIFYEENISRKVFNQTLDLVGKRAISIVRIPGHVTFDQEENYRQALYHSIKRQDSLIIIQFGDIVILNSGHHGFSLNFVS